MGRKQAPIATAIALPGAALAVALPVQAAPQEASGGSVGIERKLPFAKSERKLPSSEVSGSGSLDFSSLGKGSGGPDFQVEGGTSTGILPGEGSSAGPTSSGPASDLVKDQVQGILPGEGPSAGSASSGAASIVKDEVGQGVGSVLSGASNVGDAAKDVAGGLLQQTPLVQDAQEAIGKAGGYLSQVLGDARQALDGIVGQVGSLVSDVMPEGVLGDVAGNECPLVISENGQCPGGGTGSGGQGGSIFGTMGLLLPGEWDSVLAKEEKKSGSGKATVGEPFGKPGPGIVTASSRKLEMRHAGHRKLARTGAKAWTTKEGAKQIEKDLKQVGGNVKASGKLAKSMSVEAKQSAKLAQKANDSKVTQKVMKQVAKQNAMHSRMELKQSQMAAKQTALTGSVAANTKQAQRQRANSNILLSDIQEAEAIKRRKQRAKRSGMAAYTIEQAAKTTLF